MKSIIPVAVAATLAAFPALSLLAQNPVKVGAGSYADSVPEADKETDSYYGLPARQMTGPDSIFQRLHLDPSLVGRPIPTNHWWTDLLIGNRSSLPGGKTMWDLKQDPYGGNQWFYPGMLAPRSYGLDLYFPNAWNKPNPNGREGGFDKGPPLQVRGNTPYVTPKEDILIADFENGYPPGIKRTGNGFAEKPSTGSGLDGKSGGFCASTRDAGDGGTGSLIFPNFTISKKYVHFLICGGSGPETQVRLVVNGATVLAASGENSTVFRWVKWDVSQWKGQAAHIEVVDNTTAGWGIIACDQIFHSDVENPAGRFGGDMTATNSVVTNWGDWNVDFRLPDAAGHKIDVTMARGIPFTWTTWTGLTPRIMLPGDTKFFDTGNHPIATAAGGSFTASAFSFTYQGRVFGVFLPDGTQVKVNGDSIEPQLAGANNYMVIGYLPDAASLAEFATVAYARPTDTKISWNYEPAKGSVTTTWDVTTKPLKGTNLATLQGWLPHHYRTTANKLAFKPYTYLTPRGTMKVAQGNTFEIVFPFSGFVPMLPAPKATGQPNDYQPDRMAGFLKDFDPGTMIGDTYWAGKTLALCAQNMEFAARTGDTATQERLKTALREALVNWLTYTPGETKGIFCYYPDWHALIGWDASYGSQAFNDLHFHYGYFAVAGATLGMYDPQFLKDYGPMLTMLVKCYGNYDRKDLSEPFLRTFDVWEGHSNAGGVGSGNGENQESSSEAMQSWGGMFLLGNMLGDKEMTAAGAMGFAMESCAVNEYWQDVFKSNFPPGYTRGQAGIVGSDGISYGTFFTGEPAWVYGIQYCPANHWNNYLVRYNPETVRAKYKGMWEERLATLTQPQWDAATAYKNGTWVQRNLKAWSARGDLAAGAPAPGEPDAPWELQFDCSKVEPSAAGVPGHVMICFQAMIEPENAAAEFEKYYAAKETIATDKAEAGSTYFLIHAIRQAGDQDFDYHTDVPTSAIYKNAKGERTCLVYNPSDAGRTVTVYNKSGATVSTFQAPPRVLTAQPLKEK